MRKYILGGVALVLFLILGVLILTKSGLVGTQKYSISWYEPSLSPTLSVGITREVFSKGSPRIEGATVIYTDWQTGAKMTITGQSFKIQRVTD